MSARILIAEDNPQVAASLESILQRRGYRVERAADGVEALQKIAAAPPELLLLDFKLPRLHGIHLLKKLRQSPRTEQLPVIVMTGVYRGYEFRQNAERLGIVAYLEKPFRIHQLLEVIEQVPGLAAAAPAAPPAPGAAAQPAPSKPVAPAAAPPAAGALPFYRHLAQAYLQRFSGQLELQGARRHRLILVDGLPVALSPGFAAADFGAHLLRKGLITEAECRQYREASQSQDRVLVEMGCLAYADLIQERLAYLSTELVAGFAQPPLVAQERPQTGLTLSPVTVNLPQVIYQGFHRNPPQESQRRLLELHANQYVGLSSGYFRQANFLRLTEEERGLLARLDGTRTLTEALGAEAGLGPFVQTLCALEMVQFAAQPLPAVEPELPLRTLFNPPVAEEPEEPGDESLESFADLVAQAGDEAEIPQPQATPAAAAPAGEDELAAQIRQAHADMQGKNYYEIFGLNQGNFSFDRLKECYFALTKEYGPDLLMRLPGAEAGLVEEILSTVSTAYNTLSDVVKKERYDELLGSDRIGLGEKGDDKFQAQVQFQSGKVFIEMEEWDNATAALQDACNIDPENGEYQAHLAWAIYRNPKHADSRAMRDKARQLLNKALAKQRTAVGFAYKGWILWDGGQENLAESEFGKALKLDARLALARQGLRAIQEKREQDKKGLFRRIFK